MDILDILKTLSVVSSDAKTHKYREVAHYEQDGIIVDTARVSDGFQPIETAVAHPEYNNGKWVIVAAYDTIEAATSGHDEWARKMTTEPLPDKLVDCQNNPMAKMGASIGVKMEFPRERR